jgi:uncharacterized iron-regulated protein
VPKQGRFRDILTQPTLFVSAVFCALLLACAATSPLNGRSGSLQQVVPNTIIDAAANRPISVEELVERLSTARMVYVGELHSHPGHHAIQLRMIQSLADRWADISVGMEMFSLPYQEKLDRWIAGHWDWPIFLKETHWYANWKYDDTLYRDILLFAQTRKLGLVALNIPFDIPSKIALGGIDSLPPRDRAMLPERIDLSHPGHREYLAKIFDLHNFSGRGNFEFFYAAQCAWEDGMAQAIADHLGSSNMVVLVGNGHIVHKFGIPDRAFARTKAPFATVYLATPEEPLDLTEADFIWVTEPAPPTKHGAMRE